MANDACTFLSDSTRSSPIDGTSRSRLTADAHSRPTAPAGPCLTAHAHHRPTAPAPPRPMVPPAPRLIEPPLGLTSSLRQETPSSVGRLHPQLLPDVPLPQEQLMFEPPFRTSTAWDAGGEFNPTQMPIFDWTPEYSEDTRPSTSSQYFTNLMTQDQDADLELLMQPDPTPATVAKGPSKRGTNYSHDEDIQLCKSWLNISNDPIIGTGQSGKTY